MPKAYRLKSKFIVSRRSPMPVAKAGEGACIALSAADEVLVESFLNGAIRYNDIPNTLEKVLHKFRKVGDVELEDVFGIDAEARKYTYSVGVK